MSETESSPSASPVPEFFCPGCGYSLRGIDSARCPECGIEIDRSQLGQSIIPWLHREKLGRFRAFWRTVYMAGVRPRELAQEMNCPARFADAVKFRRVVALHVWLTFLAAMAIWFWRDGTEPLGKIWVASDVPGSLVQVFVVLAALAGLWVLLLMVCGVASYCFQSKAFDVIRQNRAIALSYYACAPLAWLPVTLTVAALTIFFLKTDPIQYMATLPLAIICIIGFGPLLIQVILMFRATDGLLVAVTHCGVMRRVCLQLFLPVASAALGFIFLFAWPAGCGAIGIMLVSLRQPGP